MLDLVPYLKYWRVVVLVALLAALGVQTYRLQGAQGRVALLQEREQEILAEQARREQRNRLTKEKTDEEYAAALRRARAVRVQPKSIAIAANQPADAGGGEQATGCVSRRELHDSVASFAGYHAERLAAVASAISQRHAAALDGVAERAEEVAAAYRACRTFALTTE